MELDFLEEATFAYNSFTKYQAAMLTILGMTERERLKIRRHKKCPQRIAETIDFYNDPNTTLKDKMKYYNELERTLKILSPSDDIDAKEIINLTITRSKEDKIQSDKTSKQERNSDGKFVASK